MVRTFHQWWESLPSVTKEIYHQNGKNGPQLNRINYIWVTNLINDSSGRNESNRRRIARMDKNRTSRSKT